MTSTPFAERINVPQEEIIVAKMNCDYDGITAWFEEFNKWCESQKVQAEFFNHWTDEKGNCASFHIPNDKHRLWAKLKYE